MFEFANSEITGVTTFFVNSQFVKENIPFLESMFSNCSTFNGIHKNHEFIPGGENIITVCLRASKNLLIQQKEVVLSIKYIMPGLFYVCFYDEWYFDVANYISVENYDVNIKFFQPNGPATQFLKVVSATFLLVCFLCLKESTFEARKNTFYFTSKALFVLEITKF